VSTFDTLRFWRRLRFRYHNIRTQNIGSARAVVRRDWTESLLYDCPTGGARRMHHKLNISVKIGPLAALIFGSQTQGQTPRLVSLLLPYRDGKVPGV
jgi:hypothetical protein